MSSWNEFAVACPAAAAVAERLLREHGLVYFATTRASGEPQLHPVMPFIVDGRLWVFIVAMSSKHADLERDGRYALHTLPGGDSNDEVMLTGRARREDDAEMRSAVAAATGFPKHDWETLFELRIERCLHTTWEGWGTPAPEPRFTRWRAPRGDA